MKKLKKKGQGMGLKMVIVAILLAVLMVVMFGLMYKGRETVAKGTMCEPSQGVCKPRAECELALAAFICPGGDVCCGD